MHVDCPAPLPETPLKLNKTYSFFTFLTPKLLHFFFPNLKLKKVYLLVNLRGLCHLQVWSWTSFDCVDYNMWEAANDGPFSAE